MDIAGTWSDGFDGQVESATLKPGAEYGGWTRDVDIAIGAIYKERGESWAAAATGAYDGRWRVALENLRSLWGDRSSTLYIRFAHEFNGDWYGWSVQADEAATFQMAWRRFRALQIEIMPTAQLVFCPAATTSPSLHLDWRKAFPGKDYVDVLSVDYYNQSPAVASLTSFGKNSLRLDQTGAPRGIEKHRQFAANMGLPFAVSEWSGNASMVDAPEFMQAFHDWLKQHAGVGPGNVEYEIQFNVDDDAYHGNFQLYPRTRQPLSAARYAELW